MHTPSPMLTTLSRGGDCPRPGVGGLPSAALNKGGTAAETPEYLGPRKPAATRPPACHAARPLCLPSGRPGQSMSRSDRPCFCGQVLTQLKIEVHRSSRKCNGTVHGESISDRSVATGTSSEGHGISCAQRPPKMPATPSAPPKDARLHYVPPRMPACTIIMMFWLEPHSRNS